MKLKLISVNPESALKSGDIFNAEFEREDINKRVFKLKGDEGELKAIVWHYKKSGVISRAAFKNDLFIVVKKKSLRKMFINAFDQFAKRWGDSKTDHITLNRYGFKNTRQWARMMTGCYFDKDGELSIDLDPSIYDAESIDDLTQSDVNAFVYDEMSCL